MPVRAQRGDGFSELNQASAALILCSQALVSYATGSRMRCLCQSLIARAWWTVAAEVLACLQLIEANSISEHLRPTLQ
jgi:hypothetical protein